MDRLGKYRLVRCLATGGMAELYLAQQEAPSGFEKTVAIKRLLPALAAMPEVVRRFINEARIASRLDHPSIVRIYDLGTTGTDYFLAMEYVNGCTLGDVASQSLARGRPMPLGLIAFIVARVCNALHFAHTQTDSAGRPLRIVHRDVSPQNILVSYAGEVKLVDFGVATATLAAAEMQPGLLAGRYGYMSPEQCRGEAVDARSDIFSVGVVLHELICRRRLFRRNGELATMRAVLEDPVPLPSTLVDVPEALERIVMRALARRAEARYADAHSMEEELEEAARVSDWQTGPLALAAHLASIFPPRELADPGGSRAVSGAAIASPAPRPSAAELLERELAAATQPAPGGASLQAAPSPVMTLPPLDGAPRQDASSPVLTLSLAGPAPKPAALPAPAVWWRRRWTLAAAGGALGAVAIVIVLLARSGAAPEAVEIRSDPSGATVYLDGVQRFGTTPMSLHDVAPGQEHSLVVILDGHEPWREKLTGAGDGPRTIVARLKRQGPGGEPAVLRVEASEPEAEVYLDGELRGTAPVVLERVASGVAHTLIVKREGFQDERSAVAPLAPGERRTVQVKLTAERSALEPGAQPQGKAGSGAAAASGPVNVLKARPAGLSREQQIGEHLPGK